MITHCVKCNNKYWILDPDRMICAQCGSAQPIKIFLRQCKKVRKTNDYKEYVKDRDKQYYSEDKEGKSVE